MHRASMIKCMQGCVYCINPRGTIYVRSLLAQERCSAVPGGRNKIFRDDADEGGAERKKDEEIVFIKKCFVFVVVSAHDE